MTVGDLYAAFALVAVLSSIVSIYLIRDNPAWAYLASLMATCVLAHLFIDYRFGVLERGPFYGGVYALAAMFAALGLIVLHLVLRIVLDLLGVKSGIG